MRRVVLTYPEIQVQQLGRSVSYGGLLFSRGIACGWFLFVPDAERIYVYELRAAHRAWTPLTWSLLFAHHQLASAEQINHQSIYRLGVTDQHLFSSEYGALLQFYLTVTCVCFKSYRLCIHRVIQKRTYGRTPAKSGYTTRPISYIRGLITSTTTTSDSMREVLATHSIR